MKNNALIIVLLALGIPWIALGQQDNTRTLTPTVPRELTNKEEELLDEMDEQFQNAEQLRDQHKYAEAEKEHRAVLAIRERLQGAEHLKTAISRIALAKALQSQGKNAEAEKECLAAISVMEHVQGAEHPETLRCRNDLAVALLAEGKNAEAEKEARAVLSIQERAHLPAFDNRDAMISRIILANILRARGKDAEAEKEYRSLIPIVESNYGDQQSIFFEMHYNLALCLEAQKKFKDALPFMRQAEAGYSKFLRVGNSDAKEAKAARERIEAAMKAEK